MGKPFKLKKSTDIVTEAEVDVAELQEGEVEVDIGAEIGEPVEYPDEQLNEEEKEVLEASAPNIAVSTDKMQKVLDLISKEFDLDAKGYVIGAYKDDNSKVTISLSNVDFDLTVKVKNVFDKLPMCY